EPPRFPQPDAEPWNCHEGGEEFHGAQHGRLQYWGSAGGWGALYAAVRGESGEMHAGSGSPVQVDSPQNHDRSRSDAIVFARDPHIVDPRGQAKTALDAPQLNSMIARLHGRIVHERRDASPVDVEETSIHKSGHRRPEFKRRGRLERVRRNRGLEKALLQDERVRKLAVDQTSGR